MLGLLFPKKCPICDSILNKNENGICLRCYARLPRVTEPVCRHCGKPIADGRAELCGDCGTKRSALKQSMALWVYTEQMKKMIADFKYGGQVIRGEFFGNEMFRVGGAWIRDRLIDCIVPVPLHWRKRRFRGFNQAGILAEYLGEHLELPVYDILLRVRDTRPQKNLDDRQRAENLQNVFAFREDESGQFQKMQRVLLVDDIYTTGSTLEECAKTIKKYGDFEVFAMCLCIGKDY